MAYARLEPRPRDLLIWVAGSIKAGPSRGSAGPLCGLCTGWPSVGGRGDPQRVEANLAHCRHVLPPEGHKIFGDIWDCFWWLTGGWALVVVVIHNGGKHCPPIATQRPQLVHLRSKDLICLITDIAQIAVFLTHTKARPSGTTSLAFKRNSLNIWTLIRWQAMPIATTCCRLAPRRTQLMCLRTKKLIYLFTNMVKLLYFVPTRRSSRTCEIGSSKFLWGNLLLHSLNLLASFCICNFEIDICLKTCCKDFCLMSCDVRRCWWYAKFFCRADMPHICACYHHLSIGLVW